MARERRRAAAASGPALPSPPSRPASPLPAPQLLACLRIIVATATELRGVRQRRADPLAGPLNPENEDQALRTLEAALQGMLQPLAASPLLAELDAAADGGGDDAAAAAVPDEAAGEAASEAAAERQLGGLHLKPGAAAGQEQPPSGEQAPAGEQQQGEQQRGEQQSEEQPGAAAACNENGFDADWRASRHFCALYLAGQRAILRRSLAECRRLLAQLAG